MFKKILFVGAFLLTSSVVCKDAGNNEIVSSVNGDAALHRVFKKYLVEDMGVSGLLRNYGIKNEKDIDATVDILLNNPAVCAIICDEIQRDICQQNIAQHKFESISSGAQVAVLEMVNALGGTAAGLYANVIGFRNQVNENTVLRRITGAVFALSCLTFNALRAYRWYNLAGDVTGYYINAGRLQALSDNGDQIAVKRDQFEKAVFAAIKLFKSNGNAAQIENLQ